MGLLACPKCPKVFTKPSHLQRHFHSHSRERPFACDLCGKRFTREDSKARHFRGLHSNEKDAASSSLDTLQTSRDVSLSIGSSVVPQDAYRHGRDASAEAVASILSFTAPPGLSQVPEQPYQLEGSSYSKDLPLDFEATVDPSALAYSAITNTRTARSPFSFTPQLSGENDIDHAEIANISRGHGSHSLAPHDRFLPTFTSPSTSAAAARLSTHGTAPSPGQAEQYFHTAGAPPSGGADINALHLPYHMQDHTWQSQSLPTWEAALESDAFLDSWLQLDPQHSLTDTIYSSVPFPDLSYSPKVGRTSFQNIVSEQQGSMQPNLDFHNDADRSIAPASRPQTADIWSQWLEVEGSRQSSFTPGPRAKKPRRSSADVYSGLKSLVGSPAPVSETAAPGGMPAAEPTPVPSNATSSGTSGKRGERLPADQWQTLAEEPVSSSSSSWEEESSSVPWSVDSQAWEAIKDRLQHAVNFPESQEIDPDASRMIPGMSIGFLKSCLHLYFARFHPSFPVIHEPTFDPRQAPAYLCLMMVAVGSTFIGTAPTSKLGQWICRRVHRLMVNNREHRLTSSSSRIEFAMAGVIGQTFCLLHGSPAELLTAEAFHGGVCNLVRRSGITVSKENLAPPIHLGTLDISGAPLVQAWEQWASVESLHRTFLGLAIHAAELYQFSSIPGLLPRRLACEDSKVEQLFAAKSATAWKGILRNMALSANETARDTSRIPLDAFHIQALLGQVLMDIHNSRQLSQHCVLLQSRYEKPTQFYSIMLNLAQDCRIPLHNSQQDTLGCHIVFRVLWHYCYVDYWSQSGDIEAAVGRYGSNAVAHQALDRLRVWVNTPPARLAALHAVCVLSEAHSLKDIGFLIPRAIYRSVLLLFCVLSLADAQHCDSTNSFTITGPVDWLQLAELCVSASTPTAVETTVVDGAIRRYVATGGVIVAGPFLAGQDRHTDIVSLLASSMRLLTTSTQWGLGEVLANLLARISINAQS